MKNNLLSKMLLSFAMMFSIMAQGGQLSGSYTIDPSQPASTTNFQDFQSAITYLTSTNARNDGGTANSGTVGVSGPVVFWVAPATYSVSAAISIPIIPGADPINTVTFDGGAGNAASRIISGSLSTPVVIFNACKYVSISNLTIKNTSSSGGGVCFYNSTTPASATSPAAAGSCNRISKCIVTISNQYGGINIGIAGNTSGTSLSTCYADSILIDSNTCNGGNYGIAVNGGSNPNYNRGIRIRGNNLVNIYYMGMYMYVTINEVHLLNNTIKMDPSYGYMGIYVYAYYCCNVGTSPYKIIGNKVTNYAYYGMYLYYLNGSQANPSQIYNNMVTSTSPSYSPYYDVYNYNYSGSYTEVFHNTFVHSLRGNTGSSSYCAFMCSGTSNVTVRNNIFANLAGGSANSMYLGTSPTAGSVNFNNYYSAGSNLMYRVGQYTSTTYKTATAGGDSSFNESPSIANMTTNDLHLTDGCGPKGPILASVPTDIDGETRNISGTMVGADEAGGQPNDMSVVKILSPVIPITTGPQDLIVQVKNIGINTITNFDISYIHNNGAPVTINWTGTLASCSTTTVTFTGANQVNLGSSNNIVVYTSSPNSSADANRSNDSARTILYAPLNGAYSIGSSPAANFHSFAEAMTALQSGMSGPVNFTIEPGNYNESVVLNAPVGLSITNPLSFDGGSAATTSITSNSTATLALIQCKYVTFRNLTINANGQVGVAIVGNTSNNNGSCNTFKRCVVNAAGTYGYGFLVSGSATGASVSHVDSTLIDSCTINNGGYGIFFYGDYTNNSYYCINNRFSNNTISGAYNYGIYIYYAPGGTVVLNNVVTMNPTNTYSYGVMFYGYSYFSAGSIYFLKGTKVANNFSNNKITAGYFGMYLYYFQGSPTKPAMICNNMINLTGSYGYYGLYMYTYQYYISSSDPTPTQRIYNNTIQLNTPNTYGYGLYYTYYGYNGANDQKADIRNNIFTIANGGTPAYIYYYQTGGNTAYPPILDYNMYYNATGSTLLQVTGASYNKTNFNLATSGGINSINVKPPFVSSTNLHLNNACYRGIDLTGWVPKDIDGDVRSTTPNIGADEYPGLSLDVSVEAVTAPTFPISAGTNDLSVRVRNNGYSVLNSFSLTYVLNGGSPVTNVWTGTFNPCDTLIVTFSGAQQINLPDGSNTVQVYSSNPNASPDMNPSNDMITVALSTPMAGDYIIGTPPSDYLNFTAAGTDLAVRGVKANVRFHAKSGTYNENVTMNNVVGTSDTSTILFHSIAENPDSVKIVSSTGYVFDLNNVSYTTFRNLSLTQNAYNSGGGVLNLKGTCTNDTVIFCKFTLPLGYSGNHINAYPANANNVMLKRNSFDGGAYWFYQQSSNTNTPSLYSSFTIDSNKVTRNYYLVYSYYTKDLKMRYNNITLDDYSTFAQFYIMFPHCVNSNYELSNNNLVRLQTSTSYSYGFYLYPFYYCNYYLTSAPAVNAKVYNNVINLVSPASTGYVYSYSYTYYANWLDYYNNKISLQDDASNSSSFSLSWYYTKYFNVYNNTFPLGSSNFYYYPYNSPGNKFINNTVTSKYQYYYAMYIYGPSTDQVFKNNIIANNSTSYAPVYVNTIPATAVWDYNNYYNQQSTGPIVNSSYNMPSWKATSGKDKNSLSYNPALLNWNNNMKSDITSSSAWSVNGRGMPDSMVTNDLSGAPRSINVVTGATDLGVYEITPTSTPPVAVASPASPTAGTTQSFLFGQDTVAKIAWDASATVPSSITVQLYSGANPPAVLGGNVMNAYWDVQASGTSTYALSLYHKGNMVGNNPDKSALIGAQRTTSWAFIYTANSDVTNNILTINGLTNFGPSTGTDQNAPFTGLTPPIFFDLHAKNMGTDVAVNWNTELNKDLVNKGKYVVERSFDANSFTAVGSVNITGDYSYSFIDQGAVAKAPGTMIYYRLRTLANDGVELNNGTTEYSKVALVSLNDQSVYPNPFSSSVSVNITMSKAGEVRMNVKDISGRVLVSQSKSASMGSTTVNVDQLGELKPGVYFLTVDAEGTSQVYKIIKN